jgi:FtsH-binding integral membrane protein
MMALFGIIAVSIVNLFLQNPALYFWISSITVVVFSGFVLYDISKILNNPQIENEYIAALQLYLDFYNIFINLLNILGIVRTRK